jgi:hypothetical protein
MAAGLAVAKPNIWLHSRMQLSGIGYGFVQF